MIRSGSSFRRLLLAAMCVGSLLLVSCAALGGGGKDAASDPSRPRFGIWVRPDALEARCPTRADALTFVEEMKARGVDTLFVQLRDESGEVLFKTEHAPVRTDGPLLLDNLLRAGRRTGIDVMAAYPLFLGPPEDNEQMIAYRWNLEKGAAELIPYRAADGIERRHPTGPATRRSELVILRDVSRLDADGFCLSHVGFPGEMVDFSPFTRSRFELETRPEIRSWPADVMTFRESPEGGHTLAPGPKWSAWVSWRSFSIRSFLTRVLELFPEAEDEDDAPRVWVMAQGYYPLHYSEGMNWTAQGARFQAGPLPTPPGYELTGWNQQGNGFILEWYAPIATVEQAREEGYEWWASVEGGAEVARRMIGGQNAYWGALAAVPYAGVDGQLDAEERARFSEAVKQVRGRSGGLLIVDWEALDRWDLWPVTGETERSAR